MAVYSQDLRDRALEACQRGESPASVARRLEVSDSWVRQVFNRFQKTGERTAHKLGGYRKPCLEPWKETIQGWIAAKPDLTLEEIVEHLHERGVDVALSTLWYQLARWTLTYKKKLAGSRTTATGRASRA